ncbi:MAG: methyltransferase domain-containing protein [Oligoflexia bacterium]|nr:methyltransferase domain-containing protein [Oligoflexia bacterium]
MQDLATEEKVKKFYESQGWAADQTGSTTDAKLWEDLRPMAQKYVAACRRKLLKYLPKNGDLFLDCASGPIQYPEYLEYSQGFKKRICVDISQRALDVAQKKLGSRGETVCASLLNLPFPDNHFDAAVSLHTIYHIDQTQQETAVRELLRVAKPGTPIVIVYSNPNRLLARMKRFVKPEPTPTEDSERIYFYAHPLKWWKQFEDKADVKTVAWRSLTAKDAKRLIPGNKSGEVMLNALLKIETYLPKFMAGLSAYPLIILTKK